MKLIRYIAIRLAINVTVYALVMGVILMVGAPDLGRTLFDGSSPWVFGTP